MRMEETIECPPSPFKSTDDPFDIKDPFEETLEKFRTEQDNENLTEEDIMELVRDKINNIKIDLENPAIAVDEIIEYLEKEENIEVSEDLSGYIRIIVVSAKVNFLQDLKRLKIDRDNPSKEEKKLLKEMALKDAEWMGNVIEYIRENRDNPKEIDKFWKEYDKTFLSFKEHKNNQDQDFVDKYDIEQEPAVTKRGILTEIAAMDLLEEIANNFKGCKKVEIKYSTPEEDVHKKIDFFLVVTFENGGIVEIPIQVTSCNLSTPINNSSDKKKKTGIDIKREREKLDEKIKFVLSNAIHTSETVEGIEINPNYKYQKGTEDKMRKFFDKNKKGVFVFIPYGEILEDKIDSIRGEKTRKECVYENGKPSRMVRDHFGKSPTIKSIETNLAQVA